MSMSSKISAFIAYLLFVFGWLFVMTFRRNDQFAVFHAKQSLRLTIFAVGIPAAWGLGGYFISLIPFVGPILASATFSLVIVAFFTIFIAWVIGMSNALRARWVSVPMFGVSDI